jgi:hypothetical protein
MAIALLDRPPCRPDEVVDPHIQVKIPNGSTARFTSLYSIPVRLSLSLAHKLKNRRFSFALVLYEP